MKLKDFDFRVWDSESKEYNEEREVVLSSKGLIYRIHTITGELQQLKDDSLEIELWTGFKDKNGNKIYENDIITYRGEKLLVSYECATWYLINPLIDKDIRIDCGVRLQGILERMKHHDKIDTENQIDIEVIGNIHEDENLLDNSIEQNNTYRVRRLR